MRVSEAKVIEETDLDGLPEPVQRYLRFTGIIGKKEIRCARFRQQGHFRTDVKQEWFPLDAVQYVATEMPRLHLVRPYAYGAAGDGKRP